MKRNAVLTEMILAVLFFSLAAMVLLRMVSAAYTLQMQSQRQSMANVTMQDALERCKADPAAHVGHAVEPCEGDARVETRVAAEDTPAGTLYTIAVDAYAGDAHVGALQSAVYAGRTAP